MELAWKVYRGKISPLLEVSYKSFRSQPNHIFDFKVIRSPAGRIGVRFMRVVDMIEFILLCAPPAWSHRGLIVPTLRVQWRWMIFNCHLSCSNAPERFLACSWRRRFVIKQLHTNAICSSVSKSQPMRRPPRRKFIVTESRQ